MCGGGAIKGRYESLLFSLLLLKGLYFCVMYVLNCS